jgi:hypothetical protein
MSGEIGKSRTWPLQTYRVSALSGEKQVGECTLIVGVQIRRLKASGVDTNLLIAFF